MTTLSKAAALRWPLAATVAVLLCGATLAGAASAATIEDARGDILPTFILNGDGLDHSDLDVVRASANRDNTNVYLSATMDGDIGLTAEGIYVWGVDRGSGDDLLNSGPNPVGAGVNFDTFIVLHQDGRAEVNLIDLIGGRPLHTTLLPAGSVTITGRTIRVAVPLAELPTAGFDVARYTYNVWPRFRDVLQTAHVSDFGPDNRNFAASVPEPTTWALLIAGFGLAGGALRRRRAALA